MGPGKDPRADSEDHARAARPPVRGHGDARRPRGIRKDPRDRTFDRIRRLRARVHARGRTPMPHPRPWSAASSQCSPREPPTSPPEEAAITARLMGVEDVRLIADVGVAGLQRLLSRLDEVREADVVMVVAGMDGALPSVCAGLVDAPSSRCPPASDTAPRWEV